MRPFSPIALALWMTTGCASKETNLSNTDDKSNVGSGTTELTFTPDPVVISIPDTEDEPFTPNVSHSVNVEIANVGDAPLILYKLGLADSADGAIGMQEVEDLTISAGSAREFYVVGSMSDREQVNGLIRVKANAAGWQEARVPVVICIEGECVLPDDTGTGDDGAGGTGTGGATGGGTGDGTGGGTGGATGGGTGDGTGGGTGDGTGT